MNQEVDYDGTDGVKIQSEPKITILWNCAAANFLQLCNPLNIVNSFESLHLKREKSGFFILNYLSKILEVNYEWGITL